MPAMMLQRPCLMRIFIVPNLQRGNIDQDAPASPGWHRPSPGGVLFFACPKKRTKRKGSPAAETTPVDGLRNRRGKNSLRSDSLPLSPGSAPRRPAQRQRAVFFPGNPSCPASSSRRGQRRTSLPGIQRGSLPRWSVGTITRSRVTGLTEKGISVAGESRPTGENRKRPTVLNETGRWSVRGALPRWSEGTIRTPASTGFLSLPFRPPPPDLRADSFSFPRDGVAARQGQQCFCFDFPRPAV